MTSEIAQILSLYGGVYSPEVEKLKWFCFDLALKLALYTSKKKSPKKVVTIQCMLPTRPSQDGKCHWSVLENQLAKNELVVGV